VGEGVPASLSRPALSLNGACCMQAAGRVDMSSKAHRHHNPKAPLQYVPSPPRQGSPGLLWDAPRSCAGRIAHGHVHLRGRIARRGPTWDSLCTCDMQHRQRLRSSARNVPFILSNRTMQSSECGRAHSRCQAMHHTSHSPAVPRLASAFSYTASPRPV
jgi:hypothetical protein